MAKDLGAHFLGDQKLPNSTKPAPPLPPKIAEPVRPVVPPPRHAPTSPSGGGGNAPRSFANSSGNNIYMSRLPKGVNESIDRMKQVLTTLKFAPHLVEGIRFVRKIRKEGVEACILGGPLDNPHWADQVVEYKRQSVIRDTTIHMDRAQPKTVQLDSPGRPHRVEDLSAKLDRISLSDGSPPPTSQSPMNRSPVETFESPFSVSVKSGGGDNRKRGYEKREGQQRLVYSGAEGEGMVLSSPSPNHRSKSANVGPTPAPMKEKNRQSTQGTGPPTPTPKSDGGDVDGGGRGSTGEDAGEVGDTGRSSTPMEGEEQEDPFALNDAAPSGSAKGKVRGGEKKGNEEAAPN